MQERNTRTTSNQSNRPNPNQANRRVVNNQTRPASNRVAGSPTGATGQRRPVDTGQARGTVAQPPGANRPINTQRKIKERQPVDRLGQAVTSLILGIIGILIFFNSVSEQLNSILYGYGASMIASFVLGFFSFIINLIGFILGIRAKRSISGRGMAIAGIVLTTIPLIGTTIYLVIGIVLTVLTLGFLNGIV